jgi:DNA-binding transcriptional MerR regulator
VTAEYRIDELARLAGTTVRNVRAYQERGLLAPPRRAGRAGLFDDGHLTRLRLIGQMLERGFTLANIGELLAAWEAGRAVEDVLGLAGDPPPEPGDRPVAPLPTHVTNDWLVATFGPSLDGDDAASLLGDAVDLGVLEPDGDRFRVTNPRMLRAAAELARAGVPARALVEHARMLRTDLRAIASRFVDLVAVNVFGPRMGDPATWPPPEEAVRLADLAHRLRHLADLAVLGELGQAIDDEVGSRLRAAVDRPETSRTR